MYFMHIYGSKLGKKIKKFVIFLIYFSEYFLYIFHHHVFWGIFFYILGIFLYITFRLRSHAGRPVGARGAGGAVAPPGILINPNSYCKVY